MQEIRDRIQNHSRASVSSKHYDRYSYMDERREVMEVWDKFVRAMLKEPPLRLAVIERTRAA